MTWVLARNILFIIYLISYTYSIMFIREIFYMMWENFCLIIIWGLKYLYKAFSVQVYSFI